jgi:hypothetical protein
MISDDMLESWLELTQEEREAYLEHGIIRGPIYKADCTVGTGAYICSFEAVIATKIWHKYDLYVVPGTLDQQSVALQFADGDGEYMSAAMFGLFTLTGHRPWGHVLSLLQHFGKFTWEPHSSSCY